MLKASGFTRLCSKMAGSTEARVKFFAAIWCVALGKGENFGVGVWSMRRAGVFHKFKASSFFILDAIIFLTVALVSFARHALSASRLIFSIVYLAQSALVQQTCFMLTSISVA
jgi:hypothetical protein